jgi:hypothetical protein
MLDHWLYKLDTPISEHCYPDYISGDYDWRDEFDIKKITEFINEGELVSS